MKPATHKEKWQVDFMPCIPGVRVRARKGATGRWLSATKLPAYVRDWLALVPNGTVEGSGEVCDSLMDREHFPNIEAVHAIGKDLVWNKAKTLATFTVDAPQASAPTEMADVDLKWGLWSPDKSIWEERAPGVWKKLERAFKGTGPAVTVHTAPRKEIRYGTVEVWKGHATVRFGSIWDEPSCHVPESVPESRFEKAREAIWEWFSGDYGFWDGDPESPIGALVETGWDPIRARSFDALMRKIDAMEADLLNQESEHSKAFDEFLKELAKELGRKRSKP